MGLFTPPKKRPNAFNYIPRYYDPEKERREERRRELRGESNSTEGEGYTPGQYIRTKRNARKMRRAQEKSSGGSIVSRFALFGGLAFMLVIIYILYPRIVNLFNKAAKQTPTQELIEEQEINPYTPITIVPNDYKE